MAENAECKRDVVFKEEKKSEEKSRKSSPRNERECVIEEKKRSGFGSLPKRSPDPLKSHGILRDYDRVIKEERNSKEKSRSRSRDRSHINEPRRRSHHSKRHQRSGSRSRSPRKRSRSRSRNDRLTSRNRSPYKREDDRHEERTCAEIEADKREWRRKARQRAKARKKAARPPRPKLPPLELVHGRWNREPTLTENHEILMMRKAAEEDYRVAIQKYQSEITEEMEQEIQKLNASLSQKVTPLPIEPFLLEPFHAYDFEANRLPKERNKKATVQTDTFPVPTDSVLPVYPYSRNRTNNFLARSTSVLSDSVSFGQQIPAGRNPASSQSGSFMTDYNQDYGQQQTVIWNTPSEKRQFVASGLTPNQWDPPQSSRARNNDSQNYCLPSLQKLLF